MRRFKTNTTNQITELESMLFDYNNREHDFPAVSDLSELPKNYVGLCLQINDHGNVTAYRVFKNGNCREIASMV